MDAEQTIAEIEWLEHIFAVPDTRPMSPSDLSAANRRHDDMRAYCLGFGFGSGMEFAAALEPLATPRERVWWQWRERQHRVSNPQPIFR